MEEPQINSWELFADDNDPVDENFSIDIADLETLLGEKPPSSDEQSQANSPPFRVSIFLLDFGILLYGAAIDFVWLVLRFLVGDVRAQQGSLRRGSILENQSSC